MRRHSVNPLHSGLAVTLILLIAVVGVVISGIPGGPQIPLPWNQYTTLHVQLADADALAPHASVEISGVKVGEVESVDAGPTYSVATIEVQQQYSDIHSNAVVYLRAHGLFGPKYIAIVPGTASAPRLQDGDTITVNQTVQPVDLSAILQDLQAPEQNNLRTFFVELGTAAEGRGDDVNHLISAADSLAQVLQTPLNAADRVSSQLSDFLVKDEQFNNYFAQAPLDQLIANSEQTVQVFANNANQLESLLTHANSVLSQLDTALAGQGTNLATIIQQLGQPGGTIDKLDRFTFLLGLFGANLTGREGSSDREDQNVVSGIVGAIENVRSAFYYADPCPATAAKGTNDNHCSVSPDGKEHFLHVRVFNFAPSTPNLPNPPTCLPIVLPGQPPICLTSDVVSGGGGVTEDAGDQLGSFSALLAS